MESPKFSLFRDSFSHIHYIQEGMDRIKTIIGINQTSGNDSEACFNALREALYFDIAVRQPFFGIVNEVVRPDMIFNRLLNTNLGMEQHISYKEAFQILTSLRWREYINRAASDDIRVFNSLLTAVNENDFVKFEAVANGISSEWFNALWWLRFIFYGDGLQTDRDRLTSLWKSSLGFNRYFSAKTDEEASDFIASERSKWAGIKNSEPNNVPEKSRRCRIRRMESAMDVELSEQIFLCGNYYSFQERKFEAVPDIRRIMADASACAESIFKYCFNQNHEANVKSHLSETAQSIDINDLTNSSFISGEERDIFDDWCESLNYSNPNDIGPLETFVSVCSYCMALIFHVIRKDIDQDAASVLNSIVASCRYTAPALKAINKEEKVQAKIKETSKNDVNPVFGIIRPVESLINDDVEQAFTHNVVQAITDKVQQEKTTSTTSDAEKTIIVTASDSKRLSFPSRIERKVDVMLKNEILGRLFQEFGGFFETFTGSLISKDEFIYLFSGRITRPDTYNSPYFWNGADKDFAGLIRLLYDGQEKGIDSIILPTRDRGKDRSSVKWSTKKQGLGESTLRPIEEKIQRAVYDVAHINLPAVSLIRQNSSKKEDSK